MRVLHRDVTKYVHIRLVRGGFIGAERGSRALPVTASGKGQLKQLPMAKLKKYAKAYNINVAGILEKDDFVDKLVATRVRLFSYSLLLLLRFEPSSRDARVAASVWSTQEFYLLHFCCFLNDKIAGMCVMGTPTNIYSEEYELT